MTVSIVSGKFEAHVRISGFGLSGERVNETGEQGQHRCVSRQESGPSTTPMCTRFEMGVDTRDLVQVLVHDKQGKCLLAGGNADLMGCLLKSVPNIKKPAKHKVMRGFWEWAVENSNLRPPRCQRGALTN